MKDRKFHSCPHCGSGNVYAPQPKKGETEYFCYGCQKYIDTVAVIRADYEFVWDEIQRLTALVTKLSSVVDSCGNKPVLRLVKEELT